MNKMWMIVPALFMTVGLAACEDKSDMEKATEQMEDAANDMKDAAEDMAN